MLLFLAKLLVFHLLCGAAIGAITISSPHFDLIIDLVKRNLSQPVNEKLFSRPFIFMICTLYGLGFVIVPLIKMIKGAK